MVSGSQPSVRLYLFVRDQPELLEDWLRFHAHVFSAANIVIVDHQTTDPLAKQVLARAAAAGAEVIPYDGEFELKHKVLSRLMLSARDRADFLVPIDVDEFVGVWRPANQSYTFAKEAILHEFQQLPRDGRKYKFGWVNPHVCRHDVEAGRRPAVYATKFPKRAAMIKSPDVDNPTGCISKTFFPADTFIATDQGNHGGTVQRDKTIPCQPGDCSSCFHTEEAHGLTLIHFGSRHSMTYANYREKMVRGAHSYNHEAKASERMCVSTQGSHYCEFWTRLKVLGDVVVRDEFHASEDRRICSGPDELALSNALLALSGTSLAAKIRPTETATNAAASHATAAAAPRCLETDGTWLSAQRAVAWHASEPACVFNVRPRVSEAIVVLMLDADTLFVAEEWIASGGEGFDLLILDASGAPSEQLRPLLARGFQLARVTSEVGTSQNHARVWNIAFAIALRGGYSHALLGRSLVTPMNHAIPAMLAALHAGAVFAVPTTNRRGADQSSDQWWAVVAGATRDRLAALEYSSEYSDAIQDMLIAREQAQSSHARKSIYALSDGDLVSMTDAFFALHLNGLMRFTPDESRPFSSEVAHPADLLVVRMLAANVDPALVRDAYVPFLDTDARVQLLASVGRPGPASMPLPGHQYEWKANANVTIAGCDIERIELVGSENVERCKSACFKERRCKGFTMVSSACSLKSCLNVHQDLEGAVTYQPLAVTTVWKPPIKGRAIGGCDLSSVSKIPPKNVDICKRECASKKDCLGFTYIQAEQRCYLKTCTALHNFPRVITHVIDQVAADLRQCSSSLPMVSPPEARDRRVAILVAVHNALPYVQRCLAALERYTTPRDYFLYLINDHSEPETLDFLRAWVAARTSFSQLINGGPALEREADFNGYSRTINVGLRAALANASISAFVLLNSDTELVSPSWLHIMSNAAYSSPRIGIVGPLSNAASYQSVPAVFEPTANGRKDWSQNKLSSGWNQRAVGRAVLRASRGELIDVPVLNGFCLFIKREVVMKVGLMDEIAFPFGFGEENDFCLRTLRLGYEIKVVPDVYVFHHKSKSYGVERRHELTNMADTTMLERWGATLKSAVQSLNHNVYLKETRRRVASGMSETLACAPGTLRVLFILNPIKAPEGERTNLAMHGGWISIVNQALGLRMRGACAFVATSRWTVPFFLQNFPQASGLFLPYSDGVELTKYLAPVLATHAEFFDVMVATFFTTVRPLRELVGCHPRIRPAYFVQDYEPDFDGMTAAAKREAFNSYSRIEDMLLFAKTAWLQAKVARLHNVTVHHVQASVDLSAFVKYSRASNASLELAASSPVRVVAMIRPSTPRRNPEGTLRVLLKLKSTFGGGVELVTFGCSDSSLRATMQALGMSDQESEVNHRGVLAREQVAQLFANSDLFLDGSFWQAFGRTGLEAMAAGCVPVLPKGSGTEEYARHGVNAMLVDTADVHGMYATTASVVYDRAQLARLRAAAIETAREFDMTRASWVLLRLLCGAIYGDITPQPCDSLRRGASP